MPRTITHILTLLLILITTAAGCDNDAPSVSAPSTSPVAVDPGPVGTAKQPEQPAQPGQPKPNYVSGRATDMAGKPLASVQVSVGGTTIAHGENTHFQTSTKADGTYSLPVPHGLYKVTAKIRATYRDRTYLLPMHPADGSVDDADSAAGIVRDFVWRTSGLKPGFTPGSTAAEHYYGGRIDVKDRNSLEDRLGYDADGGPGSKPAGKHYIFAPGTVLALTITPDGPLIDGSAGKPLTFTMTIDEKMNYDYNWRPDWYDIPVGRYTLTAEIRPPGGAPAKLARVASISPQQAKDAPIPKPAASTTIDFLPDTSQTYAGGTHAVTVYVVE